MSTDMDALQERLRETFARILVMAPDTAEKLAFTAMPLIAESLNNARATALLDAADDPAPVKPADNEDCHMSRDDLANFDEGVEAMRSRLRARAGIEMSR